MSEHSVDPCAANMCPSEQREPGNRIDLGLSHAILHNSTINTMTVKGRIAMLTVCVSSILALLENAGEAGGASRQIGPLPLTAIQAIAFSPDGTVLAAAGFGRSAAEERVYQIAAWKLQDETRIASLQGHREPVAALCFSPDGTLLAGAAGGKVHLWDLAAGKLQRTVIAGPAPVLAIVFLPNERRLAGVSGELDKPSQVTWWDTVTGQVVHRMDGPPAMPRQASACFSADGKTMAVAFADMARVYDAQSREVLQTFHADGGRFESCDLSPDGKVVAVASRQKVSYFDARTAKLVREWTLDAGALGVARQMGWRIMSVLFSPDGKTSAVAVDLGKRLPSGIIVFRDAATDECVRSDEQVWARTTRFVFAPDGQHLAYGRGESIFLLARDTAQVAAAFPARPLTYEELDLSQYQSFIKNWDHKAHPVHVALIRNLEGWNTIFHPAPVMFGNRPFHPEKEVFSDSQFLLVARVVWHAEGRALKAESLQARGNRLELRYTYVAPQEGSFTVKQGLCLRIPKDRFESVAVFENGTHVATLNLAKGQWSIPAVAAEGN